MDTIEDEGNFKLGKLVFGGPRGWKADTWLPHTDTEPTFPERGAFQYKRTHTDTSKLQLIAFEVNYPSEDFMHKLTVTPGYLQKMHKTYAENANKRAILVEDIRLNMKNLVDHISQYRKTADGVVGMVLYLLA